jgi:choline dehydrogenase-like flavoprotein
VFVDDRAIAEEGAPARDLCIVGAGAAGIPLALEFVGTPIQVLLLESGGAVDDGRGQGIYTIRPGRPPQLVLDAVRRSYFGGNTNHWFGNCRPLDPADFESRDWIPHSGWPMSRGELLPFYERAQGLCGLGDFRYYDIEACRPSLAHQPPEVDPAKLVNHLMHRCPVPSFADLYRRSLADADNIRICLRARATRLERDARGGAVRALQGTTAAGRPFRVRARTFVLAAGGIENARLLLCSADGQSPGLGNDHDLVGRFFMEHPFIDVPLEMTVGEPGLRFYGNPQDVGATTVWGQLGLSDAFTRAERVPGLSMWFQRSPRVTPAVAAAARLKALARGGAGPSDLARDLRTALGDPGAILGHVWRRLRREGPEAREEGYSLRVLMEQAPDPQKRIRLSSARDRHGQRRAALGLGPTIDGPGRHERALTIAAEALGLDGRQIARQVQQSVEAGRPAFFWHHIGATRMHEDPARGVVDRDCRVHGLANLFVAGSSTFPTGGTASPTLTIVALALRLARHLGQHHL